MGPDPGGVVGGRGRRVSDSPRIAVAVSGTGRSLENLIARSAAGRLNAQVALTVADRRKIRALEVSTQAGIPFTVVRRRMFADPDAFSEAVFAEVERAECQLLVLAGYLKLLPVPKRWEGRVINIHPSLLPKHGGAGYFGDTVHQEVLEHGDKVSGCTVHYVDNQFDNGPHILQRKVEVHAGDSVRELANRVFAAECEALPEAIEIALSSQA